VAITPSKPYRPQWWQVWLLPFAAPLVISVLLAGGLVVWWTAFGGRQAVEHTGQDVSRGIATVTYRAILEGQRIQGVDTSAAARLPVLWGVRRIGQTRGVMRIGPRPLDTLTGAAGRWAHAESLVRANLGSRTSIISSVLLSRAADSAQRQSGLALVLASPSPSVIYAGELERGIDTADLAGLVAVLESVPGAAGVPLIRLNAGRAAPAGGGQLWLGPGPVILPMQ
jgi:hypothetical protein